MLQMTIDDGLLLPLFQPEITGDPAVVFVRLAIPLAPAVELAARDAEPLHDTSGADPGLFRPASDEIHDLVPHIVRCPDPHQISPRLFFKAMCSAINSATTSSLAAVTLRSAKFLSGPSSSDIRCVLARADGRCATSSGRLPPRSRRTPSATGRRPSAGGPAHRTASRSAPDPANASSKWLPSLRLSNDSVSFSCVLSVILTAERSLRFQLRQNNATKNAIGNERNGISPLVNGVVDGVKHSFNPTVLTHEVYLHCVLDVFAARLNEPLRTDRSSLPCGVDRRGLPESK